MMIYHGTWNHEWNDSNADIRYLHDNLLECKWKNWESDSRNILEADKLTLKWHSEPSIEGRYSNGTIVWNNGNRWNSCRKDKAAGNRDFLVHREY